MRVRTLAGAGLTAILMFSSVCAGASSQAASTVPMPAIHVFGQRLVTSQGQQVLLRGVNVNALVQYNPAFPEAVPVSAVDFSRMAAMGFNFVRLPLSLSALEPTAGHISNTYMNRISQVVQMAAKNGLWVLLDVHQDRYAASLFPGEADGFPQWMVDTLGLSTRPEIAHTTNLAVQAAFTEFWRNHHVFGHGLWHWYDVALKALAMQFASDPDVVGYDVMNEPNPGLLWPPTFDRNYLLPFYRQSVAVIRSVDPTKPIFLEPDVVSTILGYPLWPKEAFLKQGIVFSPHMYTGVFAIHGNSQLTRLIAKELHSSVAADTLRPWNGTAKSLALPYARAARFAAAAGVPWVVGEFGTNLSLSGDSWVRDELGLQQKYGVGSAYWLWSVQPKAYDWGLQRPNGMLTSPQRVLEFMFPHPLLVGGTLLSETADVKTGRETLVLQGQPSAGPTVIAGATLGSQALPRTIVSGQSGTVQFETFSVRGAGYDLHAYRAVLPSVNGKVTVVLRN